MRNIIYHKPHCLLMAKYYQISIPSIVKKYLMAITGAILTLFVLAHMAGNLQLFLGPNAINAYAHTLQNLPYGLLWINRIFLLAATLVHIWMAILLTIENRTARPGGSSVTKSVQATLSSKTMGLSGSIVLIFIVFHILHFTVRSIYPVFQTEAFYTLLDGERVYNVYKMMVDGFSVTWVSLFYIVAMGLLCMHLCHGVSSMFQSLGLRNKKWRPRLHIFARIYAWIVFLGFIAIPIAVLITKYTTLNLLPA